MSIDLTPIFQAVIAVIAALVTYRLIPWIKARTTKEQQSLLKATVKTLVFAAEQLYGAGRGIEKFEYVANSLSERGFTFNTSDIEAAVKESFGHYDFDRDADDTIIAPAPREARNAPSGERYSIDEKLLESLHSAGATQAEIEACKDDFDAADLLYRLKPRIEIEPPAEGGVK